MLHRQLDGRMRVLDDKSHGTDGDSSGWVKEETMDRLLVEGITLATPGMVIGILECVFYAVGSVTKAVGVVTKAVRIGAHYCECAV